MVQTFPFAPWHAQPRPRGKHSGASRGHPRAGPCRGVQERHCRAAEPAWRIRSDILFIVFFIFLPTTNSMHHPCTATNAIGSVHAQYSARGDVARQIPRKTTTPIVTSNREAREYYRAWGRYTTDTSATNHPYGNIEQRSPRVLPRVGTLPSRPAFDFQPFFLIFIPLNLLIMSTMSVSPRAPSLMLTQIACLSSTTLTLSFFLEPRRAGSGGGVGTGRCAARCAGRCAGRCAPVSFITRRTNTMLDRDSGSWHRGAEKTSSE